MRLIDADALLKESMEDGAFNYVDSWQIANAPTIDAVEVVRCKDCKHGHKTTPVDSGADILCDYCDWEYFDVDYCSRGERKDD